MVITPCDAPMRRVNVTTSGRLPVPSNSNTRDGGRTPSANRATVIARRLRPKTISTTRPPNWATPFSEAIQTATAVASPAASSNATSWTDTTPNTYALSDMISVKSAMAIDRTRPSSGGPSADTRPAVVAPLARSGGSRRASPNQCSGRQMTRLMTANSTSVWRQPTCSFRAWPTTQNTDEANAPNSVRYEIAARPRDGATCTSAANAASYRHRRMPRPRNAQTARYIGSLVTWPRANRLRDTRMVPSVIIARAPRRAVARPTAVDTTPLTSSATVKPRKTRPRLQPVSWLIGPASTPRQ